MPHGVAPTRIVATTFSEAVSMTDTSFDDPLAVYKNLPSDVSPMPHGRAPTRTSATTLGRRKIDDRDRPRAAVRDVEALLVRRKREPHRQRARRAAQSSDAPRSSRRRRRRRCRRARTTRTRASRRAEKIESRGRQPTVDAAEHGAALRIDDGHGVVAFARDVDGRCRSGRRRTPSGSSPTSTVRTTSPLARSTIDSSPASSFETNSAACADVDVELFGIRAARQHAQHRAPSARRRRRCRPSSCRPRASRTRRRAASAGTSASRTTRRRPARRRG